MTLHQVTRDVSRARRDLAIIFLIFCSPLRTDFSYFSTSRNSLHKLQIAMSGAEQVARTAKESFDASQLLDSSERHSALVALKKALTDSKDEILAANKLDIEVRSPLWLSVSPKINS